MSGILAEYMPISSNTKQWSCQPSLNLKENIHHKIRNAVFSLNLQEIALINPYFALLPVIIALCFFTKQGPLQQYL